MFLIERGNKWCIRRMYSISLNTVLTTGVECTVYSTMCCMALKIIVVYIGICERMVTFTVLVFSTEVESYMPFHWPLCLVQMKITSLLYISTEINRLFVTGRMVWRHSSFKELLSNHTGNVIYTYSNYSWQSTRQQFLVFYDMAPM